MAVTKINAKQIDAFAGTTSSKLEVDREVDMNSNDISGVGELVASSATIANNVVINGNLTVAGDQLIANVSILEVEDLAIRAAKTAANSSAADGAGLNIGLSGTYDQSILWNHAAQRWNVSAPMSASSLKGVIDAASLGDVSTTNLAEGSNLYFTNERVDDRVGALIVGGSGVIATYNDAGGSLTLDFDIDELTALGGTGVAQGDHFVFSDGGTEKKITFSNLEDAIFGNVSGDATIAAGGALTLGSGVVEHGMLAEDIISGQAELAHADIVDADELMISDGGVIKRVGVDSLRDHFFGVVSGDATIADGGALTIAAGAVENAMLADDAVGADELAANAVVEASIVDNSVTLAKMAGLARGKIIYGDASGDPAALAAGANGKLLVADANGDLSWTTVSGDATLSAGALTISAGAVEDSMLADDVATGLAGDGLGAASGVMKLDLNELTGAGVVVADDSIAFIDATDNSTKKESIADLVAAMAGSGLAASNGQLSMAAAAGAAIDVAADSFRFTDANDSNITKTESLADYATAIAGTALSASSGVLHVNIDGLSALGGTGLHQTNDYFMFSDGGTEKKITFSNLQDAIFADVSGDATIAAGGALTIGAGNVNGSMLNTDAISGQAEMTGDVADTDELMISDAGSLKRVDFSVFRDAVFADVSGDATVAAGGALTIAAGAVDYAMIAAAAIKDEDNMASDSASHLATQQSIKAYVDASVLDIDALGALGSATLHQTQDHFVFSDNGTEKKVSFSNLQDSVFADVSGDATIAAGGALTLGAGVVEHGMLAEDIISGQAELAHADIADADELMISDAGTIKRVGVDSLRDHFFGVVSGDATIADGGALTISANSVEDSMLHDNVATGLAGNGLSDASGVMAVAAQKQTFASSDFTGLNCTLTAAPTVANSVQVFLNGQLLTEGDGKDWTRSGTTLTLEDNDLALDADDVLTVHWL